MNYNTKQFWEKVKQDFRECPIDYLCLCGEIFKTEWQKAESEIKQLSVNFLQSSEWAEFIEVKCGESEGVLFWHKETNFWKENWRYNVRVDFIDWNICRLAD